MHALRSGRLQPLAGRPELHALRARPGDARVRLGARVAVPVPGGDLLLRPERCVESFELRPKASERGKKLEETWEVRLKWLVEARGWRRFILPALPGGALLLWARPSPAASSL